MEEEQKQQLAKVATMLEALQKGMDKEYGTHSDRLDSLQLSLDKKPSSHGFKLEQFDGNPLTDAMTWLHTFRQLAKLNNWGNELQLNALPLYKSSVVQAWVLSLSEDITSDLDKLFKAFQERFASGPQDWLLSQKLSARKQQKGESLDDYIADITRLSWRLKLSEKESMQVLIEGLLPDLQCHVSLGRPKTTQGAISLARIKDVVNQRQGLSDSQALFTQMQTMFKDLMASTNAQVVAATATPPPPQVTDKRVDELSKQVKQLQKQLQQQSAASLAAYDQPPNPPRSFQSRNWQGQPTRQVEQLQRQVSRL